MSTLIASKFMKMGARVKVHCEDLKPISVDVQRDETGEHFVVRHDKEVELRVLDVHPQSRHLLLVARRVRDLTESTFLCGRDEKSWFTAAIPESAHAMDVQQAKDALKPEEVWESIRDNRLPMSERDTRRNAAFLRQGEWFFLPRPWLQVKQELNLKNEAIRRGGGKPHMCEFLHRVGGQVVFVADAFPNGLTFEERRRLSKAERKAHEWRRMARDARVYVKGWIEHADHTPIVLPYWHQVVMNTETRARAMRHVAFLD